MTSCPDCGSTHMGAACGLSFGARLRTMTVDKSNFDTAERSKTYYDSEPIKETFGENSKERMKEETQGLGYARKVRDTLYRKDKHGGRTRVSKKELDNVYLGGSDVESH